MTSGGRVEAGWEVVTQGGHGGHLTGHGVWLHPPTLSSVAVNRILKIVRAGQALGVTLIGIEVFGVLGPQGEGGGGDGGWEAEPLDNLLPLLLVDDLHKASSGTHQIVQLVQVENLLGHDGKTVNRSSSLLHEGEEFIQELFPLGVVVNFIELQLNYHELQ